MNRALTARWSYLRYLHESRGIWGVVSEVAFRLLRPIYHHQRQAIFLNDVQNDEVMTREDEEQNGQRVECLTLVSPTLLDAFQEEVSADVWPGLERRFEEGRIAFIARAVTPGEERGKIVGYSIWERGVFSALGRRGPVSRDIFFDHYIYVDGAYRGRRIFRLLRVAAQAYCRTHEIKMVCAVTSTRNRAALRAHTRMGDRRVGFVSRVAVLTRLLVWETPWEEIDDFLDG